MRIAILCICSRAISIELRFCYEVHSLPWNPGDFLAPLVTNMPDVVLAHARRQGL